MTTTARTQQTSTSLAQQEPPHFTGGTDQAYRRFVYQYALGKIPLEEPRTTPLEDSADNPQVIFERFYAKHPTVPLARRRQPVRWALVIAAVVLWLLPESIACWYAFTYPVSTVFLVLAHRTARITTPLSVQTRTLAPVTLRETRSAPTTGRGHQDAMHAVGMLTFYNGQATSVTLAAGITLTTGGGIQVATDQVVTIPAATPSTPPTFGESSVPAHAVLAGAAGNIETGALSGPCCLTSVFVKNLSVFTGGRDARDYQAVAQRDLDVLSDSLEHAFTARFPHAFALAPGEAVEPNGCHTETSADHQTGEEATMMTVTMQETCGGLAYRQADLEQQALHAFTSRTLPGAGYRLVGGSLQAHLLRFSPMIVQLEGTWVYSLSQAEQARLAAHLAGMTPAQATHYLLRTGYIQQAVVAQQLPRDPHYIRFIDMEEGHATR